MKAVLQRVLSAGVTIDGQTVAQIGPGLMILLGIAEGDTSKEAQFLAEKVAGLRIFSDTEDKMNLSLLDIGGNALVVSNFTLCADSKKGRRPSYTAAARPEQAEPLYELFVSQLAQAGVPQVQTGRFGADMKISILNDGPVTIILDTDEIMPRPKTGA